MRVRVPRGTGSVRLVGSPNARSRELSYCAVMRKIFGLDGRARGYLTCLACVTIVVTTLTAGDCAGKRLSSAPPPAAPVKLPDKEFTRPPEKPHDASALYFTFDQLDYYYRVPGEFTHRLTGDQYGFEHLSFIISDTHPGGGPGLHVHDVEEAHVLLEGTARYRVGDQTFTVRGPYVARVPAGVPHTFINAGTTPFHLIAVFASKHPTSKRLGPNPLLRLPTNQEEPRSGFVP